MLTSTDGLAILKEKEEKKKQEKEEKEKRKQERLDKRKKKEDLARKKAEERASKAKNKKNPPKRSKHKQSNSSSVDSSNEPSTSHSDVTPAPSSSAVITVSGDLDYCCCECLGTYKDDIDQGNGAEWIQCGCGQWIHEECIDVTATDEDGNERICSNCVI